ncbi:MAG: riboflavin synthase [Proteobacteria bacterium]|nr:riboflavin synthase [Pseudomonadota bacterium]MCZ6782574.1 riboflavin synthase [Pseudomonadota bacterium]
MFTGIVERVGVVAAIEAKPDSARISIEAAELAAEVGLGDSVAVNGACLTVAERDGARIAFDAVRETLERTNLSDLEPGSPVNLERALRAGGRLDGHMVQGHVDTTGRVDRVEQSGDDVVFAVACEPDFAELLVEKGSVAIDGVSLTVVAVEKQGFDVVLIPYTLRETTLGKRKSGERLNLEADILGKYVKRYIERLFPPRS